jgi:hypothetical protein
MTAANASAYPRTCPPAYLEVVVGDDDATARTGRSTPSKTVESGVVM